MNIKVFFTAAAVMIIVATHATTINRLQLTCGNCGAENEVRVVGSTNQMSAPDLDWRPAEMARSAMRNFVQECSKCHYCAVDLQKKPQSDEAKKIIAKPMTEGTDRFARAAEIEAAEAAANGNNVGKYNNAGFLFLCAAWQCDDKGNSASAVDYRRQAAAMLERGKALADEKKIEFNMDNMVMLCDIYRRIGDFAKAEEVAQAVLNHKTLEQKMAELQLKLCREKKTDCHTLKEIPDYDFIPAIEIR